MPLCSQIPRLLRGGHLLSPRPLSRLSFSLALLPCHRLTRAVFTRSDRLESKRGRKRARQSPNQILVDALEESGFQDVLPPESPSKVDLSYVNPIKFHHDRISNGDILNSRKIRDDTNTERVSLQRILATYLRRYQYSSALQSIDEEVVANEEVVRVDPRYSTAELDLLNSAGYNVNDVKQWASILTTRNPSAASRKVLAHVGNAMDRKQDGRKPLPMFIFLFLLRRTDVTPQALKNFLTYAWYQLRRQRSRELFNRGSEKHWESSYPLEHTYPTLNGSASFIMVVRLIQLARRKWPQALVPITAMAIECLTITNELPVSNNFQKNQARHMARLSFRYNRILSLLSLPSPKSPVHSVVSYHRAQFDLILKMAEHDPPIPITREGYRSIVAVQLIHKKTARERDWASLKALSWPPWKEEKIGADAEKDSEYGVSRALEAIRRGREAGYGSEMWEKVAQVLSGWDVDQSPTIQTRVPLVHNADGETSLFRLDIEDQNNSSEVDQGKNPALWASRIRATRTVYEAWAGFIASEQHAVLPNEDIYYAMLEKLAAESRRQRALDEGKDLIVDLENESPLSAGDSMEVFPPPTSPRHDVYVSRPPPSFDALAKDMFSHGIIPSAPRLSFIITNAETLHDGLEYCISATSRFPIMKNLLSPMPDSLEAVPNRIFSTYLTLLCKFPVAPTAKHSRKLELESAELFRHLSWEESPFHFALRLLKKRRPKYNPPYHRMLAALGYDDFQQLQNGVVVALDWQQRHSLILSILEIMQSARVGWDMESLRIVCVALEATYFAAPSAASYSNDSQQDIAHPQSTNTETHTSNAEDTTKPAPNTPISSLRTTAGHINRQFSTMALSRDRTPLRLQAAAAEAQLPRLLELPNAAALHAYVRVLGIFCDWARLAELARWMKRHREDIAATRGIRRNDAVLFRRTFVAMRVFLERSWLQQGEWEEAKAAPERVRSQIRGIVEELEGERGWPEDEEVAVYIYGQRFPDV